MRVTRAYVINIRKIICYIILFLITASSLIVAKPIIKKDNINNFFVQFSINNIKKDLPLILIKDNGKSQVTFINVLSFCLNESIEEPVKILLNNIFFIKSIKEDLSGQYNFMTESNNYYITKVIKEIISEKNDENIKYNAATEKTINSIKENGTFLEKMGITLDNKTTYNVDLNKLYNEKLNINSVKDKPQVLIVHTHGSESYNPTDRNQDITKNIVKVGSEMAKVFEKNGIKVIHSEKMHDIPKFNNSYKNSLSTVNEMLKKYPTISVVLDIHRDAMIAENGEVYKVVKEVEGEKFSQVMFVVGTDQGGLSHNNWRENLKFAIKCQKRMNEIAPNVARPINLRQERFNQHTTNASVIIEIGTNGNTLIESINSGKITAQAISDVLNQN